MPPFLQQLRFDRLSFWLGFLAGSLLWWLFNQLRPLIGEAFQALRARLQARRAIRSQAIEIRLANAVLEKTQRMHLAAGLFPLDQVLVTPRLLAPPAPAAPASPGSDEAGGPEADSLPYLPDWPELGGALHAGALSAAQALQGGATLAFVGRPGSGKSVALAALAAQLARRDPALGAYAGRLPLLAHAAELDLSLPAGQPLQPAPQPLNAAAFLRGKDLAAAGEQPNPAAFLRRKDQPAPADPLSPLIKVLALSLRSVPQRQVAQAVAAASRAGQAVLLLDGLDELSPAVHSEVVHWLESVQRAYPALQMVVTADDQHAPGLGRLGCAPLALAGWDGEMRRQLLAQWRSAWISAAPAGAPAGEPARPDPYLAEGWLLPLAGAQTPLELSLSAWSAFGGDALGPAPLDGLAAHLRRLTSGDPAMRQALEQIAAQSLLTLQPVFGRGQARAWAAPETGAGAGDPERIVSALVANGALTLRSGDRLQIAHPLLAAWLAAAEPTPGLAEILSGQPHWPGQRLALEALAAVDPQAAWLHDWLAKRLAAEPGALHGDLFAAARRLGQAGLLRHPALPQAAAVLRRLGAMLKEEEILFALRARALAALVYAGAPGVPTLLRQELAAAQPRRRQLGALGLGAVAGMNGAVDIAASDEKGPVSGPSSTLVPALAAALNDVSPLVQRAAGLALGALATPKALEALAEALLNGSPAQRRGAALALAGAGPEGQAVLADAAAHEDLHVRRAAVAGLERICAGSAAAPAGSQAAPTGSGAAAAGETDADRLSRSAASSGSSSAAASTTGAASFTGAGDWARQALNKLLTDQQWLVQSAAAQALENLSRQAERAPQPLPRLFEAPWLIAYAGRQGMGVIDGEPAERLAQQAMLSGSPDEQAAAIQHFSRYAAASAQNGLAQIAAASPDDLGEWALVGLWQIEWGS